jgi:Kef-type K+ transport system membrane component KefB
MDEIAKTLTTLGALFIVGLATDLLGRRTRLPRVTLLLVFGLLFGPFAFDLLPDLGQTWRPVVTDMALVMVGFLLGEKLTLSALRENGMLVLWISLSVVVATVVVMLAGLLLLGVPVEVALLLAGLATATDPAATADVIHEARADGSFTRTLLAIVAVDDAWGLIVFSVMLAAVGMLTGHGTGVEALLSGAWEIGGAVVIGVGLGIPMAYVTGRIEPGEPTLVEALGGVLLCGGLAVWLEVSFLLASMTLGVVVANLAHHHTRPFHAIEDIEWPFMILFFVLAGASLDLGALGGVGLVLGAYVALRILGRLLGIWAGAAVADADRRVRRWMGMALMPQAGVALGMALLAARRLPGTAEVILPVAIGATIFFEVVGPIMTRQALVRAGEITNTRN